MALNQVSPLFPQGWTRGRKLRVENVEAVRRFAVEVVVWDQGLDEVMIVHPDE